jgi:hypothetical protein
MWIADAMEFEALDCPFEASVKLQGWRGCESANRDMAAALLRICLGKRFSHQSAQPRRLY